MCFKVQFFGQCIFLQIFFLLFRTFKLLLHCLAMTKFIKYISQDFTNKFWKNTLLQR